VQFREVKMRDLYKASHDATDCFARLKDMKGNLVTRKKDNKVYICDCLDSNDCYGCSFYKKGKDKEEDKDD